MENKIKVTEAATHEELMDLACKRLYRELNSFKEQWANAIDNDPSALYGWMSFGYCLRSDIIFYFEGNNDVPIPDDKLRAIINEPGNALDVLVKSVDKKVSTEYLDDIKDVIINDDYES